MLNWISLIICQLILAQLQYDHGFINPSPLFYWLFPSNTPSKSTPLIIWFEGGPGCPFLSDIFMDNGPFRVNDSSLPVNSPYSWTAVGDLLFIDQPIGTGFSLNGEYRTTETKIADDLLVFFNAFFNKYPKYLEASVYITGHSYAGHYIAAGLPYLMQSNPYFFRNVKGVFMGDPLVSTSAKYLSMPEFTYHKGLISSAQYFFGKAGAWLCSKFIEAGFTSLAYKYCEIMSATLVGIKQRFNTIDIKNTFINYTNVNHYLPTLLKQLNLTFNGNCNAEVKTKLREDYYTNYEQGLKYIAERVPVVLFYGDNDYVDSWESGEILMKRMYGNFPKLIFDWKVLNKSYGYYYKWNNITMIHVNQSGHMVVLYQPEFAMNMVARYSMTNT